MRSVKHKQNVDVKLIKIGRCSGPDYVRMSMYLCALQIGTSIYKISDIPNNFSSWHELPGMVYVYMYASTGVVSDRCCILMSSKLLCVCVCVMK